MLSEKRASTSGLQMCCSWSSQERHSWELTLNVKYVWEEGEHTGTARAVKKATYSLELTLNVKVVGAEGKHGGAANVDGVVKDVTFNGELTLNVKDVAEWGCKCRWSSQQRHF